MFVWDFNWRSCSRVSRCPPGPGLPEKNSVELATRLCLTRLKHLKAPSGLTSWTWTKWRSKMFIWKQQFPLSCDLSHFLKRITLESVTIEDPELSQVNKCQTTIQCAACAWHIDSNMSIVSPGRAERVVTLHWGHPDRDGVLCIYIAYSTYKAIPRSKPFKTYIIYILHMNNMSCTF